jgi:hypothetical protein
MVWRFVLTLSLLIAVSITGLGSAVHAQDEDRRLITVYDHGVTRVFLTKEKTLGKALQSENIELDTHDTVEPAVDQVLVASNYKVNKLPRTSGSLFTMKTRRR